MMAFRRVNYFLLWKRAIIALLPYTRASPHPCERAGSVDYSKDHVEDTSMGNHEYSDERAAAHDAPTSLALCDQERLDDIFPEFEEPAEPITNPEDVLLVEQAKRDAMAEAEATTHMQQAMS